MIRRDRSVVGFFATVLALLAFAFSSFAQAAASVTDIQLAGSVRSGRTTVDYTYRIVVHNDSPALTSAQASVQSSSAATQVLKGNVLLGDLAAGATNTSSDTFTIRQDRSVPFNPASLAWVVTGVPAAAVPASIDVSVSEPFVAPDGSVTVTPVVRDADGQEIDGTGLHLSLAVTPIGTVTGNPPVVDGLTVSFPKLIKRLLNQNTTLDPDGQFAATDPTDPNYGKETGGRYRITVSLDGTALSSSKDVAVLPSGTAAITFKTSQYAGGLESVLATALQARQSGDATMMGAAKAALQSITTNQDYSYDVLSVTRAMAPPNGFLVTPAQLIAHGFVAGPQDAQFATALANLITSIRAAKTQVDAFNIANMTPESIAPLQNATTAYQQALATLQALQLSTLGAAQQEAAINQVLATELPKLLDSIKSKSVQLLAAVNTAGLNPPVFASETLTPTIAQSPQAMYAGTRPVQYWDFWNMSFSVLTNLSGAARTNIIALTLSLVNDLVNILTKDIINTINPGEVSLDYTLASSSLEWVCPYYAPTRVGCDGNVDPSNMRVVVIGCIPNQLMASIATLRAPGDLGAGIRLVNKVISTGLSLQAIHVGAVVTPDYVGEDDFGMASYMLYFANGWPPVSSGSLPCVGIVIVVNTATGGISAENREVLGKCGG